MAYWWRFEQEGVEQDVDYLCGELDEENKNNGDPTDKFILDDEVVENSDNREEQPLNLWQWYEPQKQLTHNLKFHGIDSSLDEDNFEKITYLSREGNFEEYVRNLKNYKKIKKIFWIVNSLSAQLVNVDVIPVLYPEFFGHTGRCTGTGTLTKVLGSAPSDRQTDKSYGAV